MVTGGARGLGLTLAEALVEAGGHGTQVPSSSPTPPTLSRNKSARKLFVDPRAVYCLDRLQQPDQTFDTTKHTLAQQFEGSLHYQRVDVQDAQDLDNVISEIAAKHSRMDGLIAAAGVQNVQPALEYPPEKISEVS